MIAFGRRSGVFYKFSNFFEAPVTTSDWLTYRNTEGAFQAAKCTNIVDRVQFTQLNGSDAKKLGRRVNLRHDWEQVKDNVMYEVIYAKFSQHPELAKLLLSTGSEELVENTTGWHDNYWGQCMCDRCINKVHRNKLGKTLMMIRKQLGGC